MGSPASLDAGTHEHRPGAARKGRLLVVGVSVAVVALVFVVLTRPSSSTVPVVGDSITFFAGRDISAALGSGYHADVHAGIGKRIDQMLPTVRDVMRDHPLAVVVDLGTNDALQAQTHPNWQTGFRQMIAALSPAQCVVLGLWLGPTGGEGAKQCMTMLTELRNRQRWPRQTSRFSSGCR